jgi:hypothetical protein
MRPSHHRITSLGVETKLNETQGHAAFMPNYYAHYAVETSSASDYVLYMPPLVSFSLFPDIKE